MRLAPHTLCLQSGELVSVRVRVLWDCVRHQTKFARFLAFWQVKTVALTGKFGINPRNGRPHSCEWAMRLSPEAFRALQNLRIYYSIPQVSGVTQMPGACEFRNAVPNYAMRQPETLASGSSGSMPKKRVRPSGTGKIILNSGKAI